MITDETEPSGVCDRRCGEDLFKGDDKVSSRNKVLNNKLFFFTHMTESSNVATSLKVRLFISWKLN